MHSLTNRITTALLAISVLLLFLAAVAELILASNVHHRLNVAIAESKNWYFDDIGDESEIPYIPFDVQQTGFFIYNASSSEIAAGALSLVTAIVIAFYMITSGRLTRAGSTARHVVVGLVILYVVAATAAVIGIMASVFSGEDAATIPDFQLETATPGGVPFWAETGWGDTTSWQQYTCRASELVGGWFVSTCKFQRGALYALIPLMALTILTTILIVAKVAVDATANNPKRVSGFKTNGPPVEMTQQEGARV